MNKQEFLSELKNAISGIPEDEMEERLSFYSEMIDDSVEEGKTEEEAVAEIGDVKEVANQIISDVPLAKLVKEKVKPNRTLKTWEIILIVLGSPLWVSLLIAAFAVMISVYAVIWTLLISLWIIELSLSVSSISCFIGFVVMLLQGRGAIALLLLGAGIFLVGASILLYFGCLAASKGTVILTKKIALGIKSIFVGKDKTK